MGIMTEVRYELDLETGAMVWGEEFYTAFGYQKSDSTSNLEWWTQQIHPEDAMVLNEAMGRLVYPLTSEWTVDYRVRKADNRYVLVHDHTTVVRDQEQRAVRLVVTLQLAEPATSPNS